MQYSGNIVYGVERDVLEFLTNDEPNVNILLQKIEEAFENEESGFLVYCTALEDETNYVFGLTIGRYDIYGITDANYEVNAVKDDTKAKYHSLIESIDVDLANFLKRVEPSVMLVCSGC